MEQNSNQNLNNTQQVKKDGTFSISDIELKNQIVNYNTLSVWKSFRKQTAMVIFFSVFITLITLPFLIKHPEFVKIQIIPVALFLVIYFVLGIFIFQGKKWAIITTGVLFTLDRVLSILQFGLLSLIGILWLLAFWSLAVKALKVEKAKLAQIMV